MEKALFFYGRPLCHKHVIRILRLAEYVHDTSVEGIGMIAALMIERVPEAASYMLPRSAVKSIIAGVFVGWTGIVLCLYKHGLLSPVACYATGRIVRVPVIHIVTPFTCEVSQLFLDIVSRIGSSVSIERMGKNNGWVPVGIYLGSHPGPPFKPPSKVHSPGRAPPRSHHPGLSLGLPHRLLLFLKGLHIIERTGRQDLDRYYKPAAKSNDGN